MRTRQVTTFIGAAMVAGAAAWAPAAGAQIRSPFPQRASAPRVETRSGSAFWLGAGLSLGPSTLGAQLDASYWNRRLYRLRTAVLGGFGTGTGSVSDIAEVALLVGSGRPVGRNWGHASAGIGQVTGSFNGGGDFSAVGLAAEAQLISQAMPHLSFGAGGNLNGRASFASITLSILIGRMPFERSTFPGALR